MFSVSLWSTAVSQKHISVLCDLHGAFTHTLDWLLTLIKSKVIVFRGRLQGLDGFTLII